MAVWRNLVVTAIHGLNRTSLQILLDAIVKSALVYFESLVDYFHRVVNVMVGMGEGYDERRRNDAAANQFLEEKRTEGLGGPSISIAGGIDQVA